MVNLCVNKLCVYGMCVVDLLGFLFSCIDCLFLYYGILCECKYMLIISLNFFIYVLIMVKYYFYLVLSVLERVVFGIWDVFVY